MTDHTLTLIEQARAGDQHACRDLVHEHSPRVYRLALRFVGQPDRAEDIAQEVFLKVFKSLDQFDQRARFSTWLHRITVNTCLDQLRRDQRHTTESLDDDQPVPDRQPSPCPGEQRDTRRSIQRALGLLSDTERAAFALRHHEGHSIAAIGEQLALSQNACKQAIFRAVHKLRAALHHETGALNHD